ncbi:MAG: cysteine--tRNA ligase, partial [Halobacteriovoraceae bacterium]|nr:cysteine--tRNA ligase [Halobacteriovoraceae bacterium]
MLHLYNSLTKKKEEFHPQNKGEVKMYVCGPTVYGYLHIGNFRGAIFFNLVANWLKKKGYKVTYAYNYTDIDDKIIKRANEEKVSPDEISGKYIEAFEEDFARLGLNKHDYNPKATDYIKQIIDTIGKLIEQNKAYQVEGEVFYSVDTFASYGALSGKKIEDLNPGERIKIDNRKKNPLDFSLWKASKKGEPRWKSPWGHGRPGWHIECTAMIQSLLGGGIDIHGGGMDLVFPHHENEIAQGEGCSGETYCRYWMHNNLLNVDNQKMSKSLGNIVSAREFMDQYHPEILKYLMLSVHYRRQLNLNQEKMEQIITELSRIYTALQDAHTIKKNNSLQEECDDSFLNCLKKADHDIACALDDDFNTSGALSQVFEVVRNFNALNLKKSKKSHANANAFIEWMKKISQLTALFGESPQDFLHTMDDILLAKRNIKRPE